MTLTAETRAAIRATYAYCCGYCGVSETDVGNELEIDHYRPVKHGGQDDIENLVYACPACNRFKGDYWPQEDEPDSFYILHPAEDDLSAHIVVMNGRLAGSTPRGWFHIHWLHLNRLQLITWRQKRQHLIELQEALTQSEATQQLLRERIRALEQEVAELQALISRLL